MAARLVLSMRINQKHDGWVISKGMIPRSSMTGVHGILSVGLKVTGRRWQAHIDDTTSQLSQLFLNRKRKKIENVEEGG
jgi:hypothetical protein